MKLGTMFDQINLMVKIAMEKLSEEKENVNKEKLAIETEQKLVQKIGFSSLSKQNSARCWWNQICNKLGEFVPLQKLFFGSDVLWGLEVKARARRFLFH